MQLIGNVVGLIPRMLAVAIVRCPSRCNPKRKACRAVLRPLTRTRSGTQHQRALHTRLRCVAGLRCACRCPAGGASISNRLHTQPRRCRSGDSVNGVSDWVVWREAMPTSEPRGARDRSLLRALVLPSDSRRMPARHRRAAHHPSVGDRASLARCGGLGAARTPTCRAKPPEGLVRVMHSVSPPCEQGAKSCVVSGLEHSPAASVSRPRRGLRRCRSRRCGPRSGGTFRRRGSRGRRRRRCRRRRSCRVGRSRRRSRRSHTTTRPSCRGSRPRARARSFLGPLSSPGAARVARKRAAEGRTPAGRSGGGVRAGG